VPVALGKNAADNGPIGKEKVFFMQIGGAPCVVYDVVVAARICATIQVPGFRRVALWRAFDERTISPA
jgi:hypothetical protein